MIFFHFNMKMKKFLTDFSVFQIDDLTGMPSVPFQAVGEFCQQSPTVKG